MNHVKNDNFIQIIINASYISNLLVSLGKVIHDLELWNVAGLRTAAQTIIATQNTLCNGPSRKLWCDRCEAA